MRIKKEINMSLIDIDRMPINPATLQYANRMTQGDIFPAVKLQSLPGGRFRLLDGRHRFVAFKLLGRSNILAQYSTRLIINL